MQDNFLLGPDADVRFVLSTLRALETTGRISSEKTIILNGITLSYSSDGDLEGQFSSSPDNILSLSLSARSATVPHWQCLTIPLGAIDLMGAAAIGVISRSQSPQSTVSRLVLRSGRDGDFVDQPFGKAMASFAAPSTHLDVIEIAKAPNLPMQAEWRDLILFFRPGPLEIEILDFRFFIV